MATKKTTKKHTKKRFKTTTKNTAQKNMFFYIPNHASHPWAAVYHFISDVFITSTKA